MSNENGADDDYSAYLSIEAHRSEFRDTRRVVDSISENVHGIDRAMAAMAPNLSSIASNLKNLTMSLVGCILIALILQGIFLAILLTQDSKKNYEIGPDGFKTSDTHQR